MDSTQIQNYANLASVMGPGQLVRLIDPEIKFEPNVKFENPIGKFVLLNVTPTLKDDENGDRHIPYNAIKNASKSDGAVAITRSNYVELDIPTHLFTIKEVKIINHVTTSNGYLTSVRSEAKVIYEPFRYGQLFIVTNIGGNLDKPKIIGVYKNDNKQSNGS
nr:MAG TPA: hypothetical protein [Caudoviricetes sp.]